MPDRCVFFLGDVVGKVGRRCLMHWLPPLVELLKPEIVIVNIENIAGGRGPTLKTMQELENLPIDIFTTGSHFFDNKDFVQQCDLFPRVIRPANYPEGNPGQGVYTTEGKNGERFMVMQLEGRTFMRSLDCPFQKAETLMKRAEADWVFVDFHAEATSEKTAFGHFLDGRVTAVLGTHTHIPTDDVQVLPRGTAYVTEAGMVGAYDSVIGFRKDIIVQKFLLQSPHRFEPAKENPGMPVMVIGLNEEKGKAKWIKRLWIRSEDDIERVTRKQLPFFFGET